MLSAGVHRARSRTTTVLVILVVALAVTAMIVAGARTRSSFDREQAITDAIRQSGDRLTRAQAECYVDRVRAELGSGALRWDATIPTEQAGRLTTIRVDCVGVANLGVFATTTTTATPGSTTSVADHLPRRPGDDRELDALHDACAAGWGQACDDLFERSVLGSEYESFASTCGGRTHELSCAAVYPSPGVILPSDAQPTTTEAPPGP